MVNIYCDGTFEIIYRYLLVLTGIEIFRSNEQTETKPKKVFITLIFILFLFRYFVCEDLKKL